MQIMWLTRECPAVRCGAIQGSVTKLFFQEMIDPHPRNANNDEPYTQGWQVSPRRGETERQK